MRLAELVLSLQRRVSPEKQLVFDQAKVAMEQNGGLQLMQTVAEELIKGGDATARLYQNLPTEDYWLCALQLRWNLQKTHDFKDELFAGKDTRPFWISKGVRIIAYPTGTLSVETNTGVGWKPIEDLVSYNDINPEMVKRFPLHLKIQTAMRWAGHSHDWRFGGGIKSRDGRERPQKNTQKIF